MVSPSEHDVPAAKRRGWGFRVAVIATCLIVGVLALVTLLHTPPGRRFVLSKVIGLLQQENVSFSTDGLSYNLFDLSLRLRNVRISAANASGMPPFATIDDARVNVKLTDLLRRRYVVEDGSLQGVQVHYYVANDGTDNVPRPPADPDQPSKPLDFLIDRLAIRDGRVRYENRAQQADVILAIPSIDIDGRALDDTHAVSLAARAGTARYRDRQAPIDRVNAELVAGTDEVEVRRLDAHIERSQISAKGRIRRFDAPELDVHLKGRIDVARAAELGGLDEPAAGTLDVAGDVKGPIVTPSASGRLAGSSLGFRTLREIDANAVVRYEGGERSVSFSDLNVRGPFGAAAGDGRIFLENSGESNVHATLSRVDAAALMRALDLDYAVLSRVDGRIDGRWPGLEYLKSSGEASFTLVPTQAAVRRSAIPVGGRIDASGKAGDVVARIAGVRAAGIDVSGRVTLSGQQRLGGSLEAHVADVGRTAAAAAAFLGRREPLLPVAVSGPLHANAQLGGTVRAANVDASMTTDALEVGRATGIGMNVNFSYSPAAVAVERLDVAWGAARASATGHVGLTGSRPLGLQVKAESLAVPELVRAMDADVPAEGLLSFGADITGTVNKPAGTAWLSGTELSAYREPLGSLSADVTIAGSEIVAREMALEKPQPNGAGRLHVDGRYNIERRDYAFNMSSTNLELVGLTLPGGETVRGPIELEASGSGTVAAPAARLQLVALNLIYDGSELGRLAVNANLADQNAHITATADRFALQGNAVIGVAAPYPSTVDVTVADLRLASLPIQLDTPLDGRLRASASASGNLAEPERSRAAVEVQAFEGTWNGNPFNVEAPARFTYADERLAIDRLRLAARDSTLLVTGDLPLTDRGAAGALTVDAHGNIATLVQYTPAGSGFKGSGDVRITGVVRGTMKSIDPNLSVTIANGELSSPQIQPPITSVNLDAAIAAGVATIRQLAAEWGTAKAAAVGSVPLEVIPELPVEIPRRGGPAKFSASVADLDPGQVPGAPEGLTGRISIETEVSASRASLSSVEGRVVATQLSVDYDGLTLGQQSPATVRIADGTATIDELRLAGSVGDLSARGSIGLVAPRPVDVAFAGNLNVAVAALFTDALTAEGDATLEVAVRGTAATPELTGFVDLANGAFAVDEPDVAAENVAVRIDMSGRKITLTNLTGDVNGGRVNGSGFVELGAGGVADVALEINADDFAFDAPLDLRSLSDASLSVTRSGGNFVVNGQVTIEEAGLTGDINFDEGLLAAMTARRRIDLTQQRNETLERVRFNVNVDTASPIFVDNNLATAEVTADLRITGTPYEPGLAGRLTVLEDSEITLNERRYEVERGVITFIDERRIHPQFDLQLHTSAGSYDVTVAVTGTPDDTESVLTSDPSLPEPDIMALLVTGRTLDEMRGEEFEVAQEQVLSYLTGRVGSQLGRGIQRATGLSEVRIEPRLIANEADPTARLTVGQELTDDLNLVYSTSLTEPDDQIWVAEYDVTRRFESRAVRQSDNSYRLELRHDVRFGGRPEPRRIPRRRSIVGTVDINSDGTVADSEIAQMFAVEAGEPYDFFRARRSIDRIAEHLREGGWLQSRVRTRRGGDDQRVDVHLDVTAGPRVDLRFEGVAPPRGVVEDVRLQWNRGVFDSQRIDDATDTLRAWLMKDNYLQPMIEAAITDDGKAHRSVVFKVQPGTRFATITLAFEGASGIDPQELDDIVNEQKLEPQLFTDPTQVTEMLERYYREQGYLVADVAAPEYRFEGTTAAIVLQVDEGPRFVVRNVSVSGTTALAPPAIVPELPVASGDPFLPFAAENALGHIRDLYWQRGYNDVRPDYELALDRETGQVDVAFIVEEGPQSVIADIVVADNEKISDRLVREQVELEQGKPLDLSLLARSRRNLYDTGAFSIVDVTREDLPNGDHPGTQPVRLNVSVREVQPIQLRYGVSFDTERGPGGSFDLSNHNSLGKARIIGIRGRYDGEIREGRLYFSQPRLRYVPVELTAAVYTFEDRNPPTSLTGRFNVSRRGASIEGETPLRNRYVLSYGYRYERARIHDPEAGATLDEEFTVAPLTLTATRESRDEVLDATRGSFVSQAFEYSPSWLGAERAYVRYLGQFFHYVPLQAPRRERFTNELIRPRFVFATGVRLGLGRGFGNELPRSERFFAGGSTTLRGFAQNAVGPIAADRVPLGGSAMLILNNELRFPLLSIFDGVVFADIGNVFPRLSDFEFGELRRAAGIGLRARTPWFLLRADYGMPIGPKENEPRGRFYFSIGQAF